MKNLKKSNNKIMLLAAALTGASLSGSIYAATATDTFDVTVTVDSACEITANNLDFVTYNTLASAPLLVNTSTIDVTCNLLTAHEVGIGSGANSTDVAARKMKITAAGGTATLDYSLGCLASNIPGAASPITTACALNCGETFGVGGDTMLLLGLGVPVPINLAGSIGASQNVPTGDYLDTLTATVSF